MVSIPDLSRLSGAEKDALILALLERRQNDFHFANRNDFK
jgi:hypothetical protein